MINFTKPVQTRDGRKVRILATDINDPDYPVAAVVSEENGEERLESFTNRGEYLINSSRENSTDLVNVTEKRTIFLNVYKNEDGQLIHFEDRSPMIPHSRGRVGRIKVVLEEGRFDE